MSKSDVLSMIERAYDTLCEREKNFLTEDSVYRHIGASNMVVELCKLLREYDTTNS